MIPLKDEQWNAVDILLRKFKENTTAYKLVSGALKKEATCEWQDDETGLMCRVMFDVFNPKYLADVKTTQHVLQPFNISKHIASMGYHWQDAFYSMAAEELRADPNIPFVFIFGKVKPPYNVRCFEVPEDQRKIARRRSASGLQDRRSRARESFTPDDAGLITEVLIAQVDRKPDQWQPSVR